MRSASSAKPARRVSKRSCSAILKPYEYEHSKLAWTVFPPSLPGTDRSSGGPEPAARGWSCRAASPSLPPPDRASARS
eukprot:3986994-Prymnesium_polylepis.1